MQPEPRPGRQPRRAATGSTEHLDDDQLACAALLTLCGPFTPMLFMGEEWAASTPFQFFTSHPEPELGEATAEGRIEEFERMGWDPAVVPDPQDPATFERSKLDWSELETGRHAVLLDVYRRLASLRRTLPELTDPSFARLVATSDEEQPAVHAATRTAARWPSTSATSRRRCVHTGEVAVHDADRGRHARRRARAATARGVLARATSGDVLVG